MGLNSSGDLLLAVSVLALLLPGVAPAVDEGRPSAEFDRHHAIRPRLFHGGTESAIGHTRRAGDNGTGHHLDSVTARVTVDGRELVLDLTLNKDLIPDTYVEKYHHEVR